VATNRRARHDYEILETIEAGVVLRGSEVKTLREGKASLQDAYAVLDGNDIVLHMQIPAYSHTGYDGHEPTRARKLLLHRKQIDQLAARIKERGLTLVPLRIYFKGQLVKVGGWPGATRLRQAPVPGQARRRARDGPGPQGPHPRLNGGPGRGRRRRRHPPGQPPPDQPADRGGGAGRGGSWGRRRALLLPLPG
jgi:SsrA-binding protein